MRLSKPRMVYEIWQKSWYIMEKNGNILKWTYCLLLKLDENKLITVILVERWMLLSFLENSHVNIIYWVNMIIYLYKSISKWRSQIPICWLLRNSTVGDENRWYVWYLYFSKISNKQKQMSSTWEWRLHSTSFT